MRLTACLICFAVFLSAGCDEDPPRPRQLYYYDMACAVVETDNGEYVMAGISTEQGRAGLVESLDDVPVPNWRRIYLRGVGATGNELWTRDVDEEFLSFEQDMSTLPSVFGVQCLHYGQFMVAGVREYWADGEWQRTMFQRKLGDDNGSSWSVDFDVNPLSARPMEAVQVLPLSTGGFLLQPENYAYFDSTTLITNVFGEVVATLESGQQTPFIEFPEGVLVQAYPYGYYPAPVSWITRRTLNGDLIETLIPELGDFEAMAIAPAEDGGYLLLGRGWINGAEIIRVNATGDSLWSRDLNLFYIGAPDATPRVVKTSVGWIIAGHVRESNPRAHDIITYGLSAEGEPLVVLHHDLDGDEILKSMIPTHDGGALLCGTTVRPDSSGARAFLLKVATDGSFEWSEKSGQ